MRRALILAALAGALAAPASAAAAPAITFGVQDDSWLHSSPLEARLKTLDRLGPDAALHHVRRGMTVAGGATSPRRTPSGMGPIQFMRGMRAAHARFDVYSHHPYPVSRRETPSSANCRYCTGILTMARLPDLLKEVRRDFGGRHVWL